MSSTSMSSTSTNSSTNESFILGLSGLYSFTDERQGLDIITGSHLPVDKTKLTTKQKMSEAYQKEQFPFLMIRSDKDDDKIGYHQNHVLRLNIDSSCILVFAADLLHRGIDMGSSKCNDPIQTSTPPGSVNVESTSSTNTGNIIVCEECFGGETPRRTIDFEFMKTKKRNQSEMSKSDADDGSGDDRDDDDDSEEGAKFCNCLTCNVNLRVAKIKNESGKVDSDLEWARSFGACPFKPEPEKTKDGVFLCLFCHYAPSNFQRQKLLNNNDWLWHGNNYPPGALHLFEGTAKSTNNKAAVEPKSGTRVSSRLSSSSSSSSKPDQNIINNKPETRSHASNDGAKLVATPDDTSWVNGHGIKSEEENAFQFNWNSLTHKMKASYFERAKDELKTMRSSMKAAVVENNICTNSKHSSKENTDLLQHFRAHFHIDNTLTKNLGRGTSSRLEKYCQEDGSICQNCPDLPKSTPAVHSIINAIYSSPPKHISSNENELKHIGTSTLAKDGYMVLQFTNQSTSEKMLRLSQHDMEVVKNRPKAALVKVTGGSGRYMLTSQQISNVKVATSVADIRQKIAAVGTIIAEYFNDGEGRKQITDYEEQVAKARGITGDRKDNNAKSKFNCTNDDTTLMCNDITTVDCQDFHCDYRNTHHCVQLAAITKDK